MKKVLLLSLTLIFTQVITSQVTDTGGNVGVGTTSPNAKLHVKDSGGKGTLIVQGNQDSSTGNQTELILSTESSAAANTTTGNQAGRKVLIRSTANSSWGINPRLGFFTSSDMNAFPLERMVISHTGNVGIGTINPKEKFHLEGNLLLDVYNNLGNENGLFFRENFTTSNIYNLSILAYDHSNLGTSPDGLSINAYDGVSFSTGSNIRNERMRINGDGNVGIGTTTPDSKLTVAGKIHSREVKVTVNAGADFVFDEEYKLPKLEEVKEFISKNGHLPEIASAKDMEENGIHLSEMNIKLLQKIEELTLYTIQQQKEIEKLKEANKTLSKENVAAKSVLERLDVIEKMLESK